VSRFTATLYNVQQGHTQAMRAWEFCKPLLIAGHQFEWTIKPASRTTQQNSRMWAMLADVSRQVDWHGQKLTSEEWKSVFTAAMRRQKVVPGIDGGFVVLGLSTSQMTKGEMAELMDLMEAFGVQHGVKFTAPEYMDACA